MPQTAVTRTSNTANEPKTTAYRTKGTTTLLLYPHCGERLYEPYWDLASSPGICHLSARVIDHTRLSLLTYPPSQSHWTTRLTKHFAGTPHSPIPDNSQKLVERSRTSLLWRPSTRCYSLRSPCVEYIAGYRSGRKSSTAVQSLTRPTCCHVCVPKAENAHRHGGEDGIY